MAQLREVVGAPRLGEHLAQVLLDPRARVSARGQSLGEAQQHVHQRHLPALAHDVARQPQRAPRQHRALARELGQVRAQQIAEIDVLERRGRLVGDDLHHLLGRHAVRAQRRDERAGGGADVDVELVHRAVRRQQIERAQRADLIHPAREPAAAEHERGLVAAPAPPFTPARGRPDRRPSGLSAPGVCRGAIVAPSPVPA